jgi:hypothetical protein
VRSRAADVDFENTRESDPMKRRMVVLDARGQKIQNNDGEEIVADTVIAATGFRPVLDQVLAPLINGAKFRRGDSDDLITPITLPTNPDVSVADELVADPSVLFLGTASRPRFDNNAAKLGQLPKEAREALLRNGAENAVAIGFRAPDTQAAVNIYLNQQQVQVTPFDRANRRVKVPVGGGVDNGTSVSVLLRAPEASIGIPNHVTSEKKLVLSSLLAYEIGNKIELADRTTDTFNFIVSTSDAGDELTIQFRNSNAGTGMSPELFNAVRQAFVDRDVQEYAAEILSKRRLNKKFEFVLSFVGGVVNPKKTVAE